MGFLKVAHCDINCLEDDVDDYDKVSSNVIYSEFPDTPLKTYELDTESQSNIQIRYINVVPEEKYPIFDAFPHCRSYGVSFLPWHWPNVKKSQFMEKWSSQCRSLPIYYRSRSIYSIHNAIYAVFNKIIAMSTIS